MSKVSCFLTKNPSIRGEEAADAPTQTVNAKTNRLTIDHLAIHIRGAMLQIWHQAGPLAQFEIGAKLTSASTLCHIPNGLVPNLSGT